MFCWILLVCSVHYESRYSLVWTAQLVDRGKRISPVYCTNTQFSAYKLPIKTLEQKLLQIPTIPHKIKWNSLWICWPRQLKFQISSCYKQTSSDFIDRTHCLLLHRKSITFSMHQTSTSKGVIKWLIQRYTVNSSPSQLIPNANPTLALTLIIPLTLALILT